MSFFLWVYPEFIEGLFNKLKAGSYLVVRPPATIFAAGRRGSRDQVVSLRNEVELEEV